MPKYEQMLLFALRLNELLCSALILSIWIKEMFGVCIICCVEVIIIFHCTLCGSETAEWLLHKHSLSISLHFSMFFFGSKIKMHGCECVFHKMYGGRKIIAAWSFRRRCKSQSDGSIVYLSCGHQQIGTQLLMYISHITNSKMVVCEAVQTNWAMFFTKMQRNDGYTCMWIYNKMA